MLKRNGKSRETVAAETLNRGEKDAYNEAFEEIRQELEALERIKMAVKTMIKNPIPASGSDQDSFVEVQTAPIDRWKISSTLLKLRNSQIFLCERSVEGAKEFAVIERFRSDSAYAQANGEIEVLLSGSNSVLLLEDYAASAEHTLRAMASNLVAKAHKIVWARFASTSPARVVQAISEKCAQAASLRTETNGEAVPHNRLTRFGMPQRT
jgi:hypothetical protein